MTGLIEEERVDDFEGQVRNHEFEPVEGIDDAVWLASGSDFACAVMTEGQVKCWSHGLIENPADYAQTWRHWPHFVTAGDQGYQGSTPSVIRGLPSVVRVQAGYGHACARTSEGALWCWGDNSTNQLGDDYAGDVHYDTFGLADRMDMVLEPWE